MNEFLTNLGLLIFRVSINLFMLLGHGLGKFEKILSGDDIKFLDPFGIGATASLYLATFAEFIASGMIILGLFNRLSTTSLIITMGVAAFIAHADDPFARKEKALMYLASYILLFLTGPGKYSLQNLITKKMSKLNKITKYLLS